MLVHKGLRDRPRLTQNTLRRATRETVLALQENDSDAEFATAWGVSAGTVANARNQNHNLGSLPLLQLADRFGPAALDTVLELVGARAIDREAVAVDVSSIPCDVARVLPLLIDLFRDGECCDSDVRKLDRAGAIDCLCEIAEMLRNRRDKTRNGATELHAAA